MNSVHPMISHDCFHPRSCMLVTKWFWINASAFSSHVEPRQAWLLVELPAIIYISANSLDPNYDFMKSFPWALNSHFDMFNQNYQCWAPTLPVKLKNWQFPSCFMWDNFRKCKRCQYPPSEICNEIKVCCYRTRVKAPEQTLQVHRKPHYPYMLAQPNNVLFQEQKSG